MKFTEEEREELKNLARSSSLREDMRRLTANRHTPFIVNGQVEAERLITFLTEYNEFINHTPRPFRPIIEREMKL